MHSFTKKDTFTDTFTIINMYQCVKTSFICRAHHTRHNTVYEDYSMQFKKPENTVCTQYLT